MPWQTTPFAAFSLLLLVGAAASTKRDAVVEVADMAASESRRPLTVLILSIPSSGHLAVPVALGEELARRGHNVTLASTAMDGVPNRPKMMAERAGLNYLNAGPSPGVARQLWFNSSFMLDIQRLPVWNALSIMRNFGVSIVVSDTVQMIELLETFPPEQWDIILADEFLGSLLTCLSRQSKTPVVQLNTGPEKAHLPPWPFPHILLGDVTDNMTFFDRLKQFLFERVIFFMQYVLTEKVRTVAGNDCEISMMSSAPGERYPQIVPSVIGFEFPRTREPLVEYVGSVITRSPDPIPDDMLTWLDSKNEGSVIYVSMGSFIPLLDSPGRAIAEGIMNTSYSTLWSLPEFNRNFLSGLELDSEQIYLSKWVPQLSVLMHKAIGMAVLHGGMNGVSEALVNGIPVLVLPAPFMADPTSIAAHIRQCGAGLYLNRNLATAADVTSRIEEIMSDANFRNNAERIGMLYRRAGGANRAADLVEFYAEVGYDHLIPAYIKYDWSWVQFHNVDVCATLLGVACVVVYVLVRVCRCALRRCCMRNRDKDKME